jgi:hypothetical protein
MRRLALLWLLAAGCNAPQAGVGHVEADARVRPDQAQTAYGIVNGIDYLPFAYKPDGCYARALYMSMELAAQSIPSSAQFLEGDLHPTADIAWRYHVAPMLLVDGSTTPTILDPSLAPQPVPIDQWIGLTNPNGDYTAFFVPGSVYVAAINLDDPSSYKAPMIDRFSQLPAFGLSDIEDACSVMYNYLGNVDGGDAMRGELVQRTRDLLPQLAAVHKLPDYYDGYQTACGTAN